MAHLGNTVINGALRVIGGENVDTINGVTVGSSPKFTDTTYTFTGGNNKFTVTPSGGNAQDVTITPSITNNITGSGTNNYLTKFSGANTITNGPALSSAVSSQTQTTKFLREDGAWSAPSYTSIPSNNVTGSGTNNYLTKFSGANTITNGPAIGSAVSSQTQSTKFLREDGTWSAPSYTTNTNNAVTQTPTTSASSTIYEVLLSGTADNSTHTEGARKTDKITFDTYFNSLSHGNGCNANGLSAHAEGHNTKASGNGSHAEGGYTTASSGGGTTASGNNSHSEGYETKATADASHAEGYQTTASCDYSHAEGRLTITTSGYSAAHAEGNKSTAGNNYAHAEGDSTKAMGANSHTEGSSTYAGYQNSHAEGYNTSAMANQTHAEGHSTCADNGQSYAMGHRNAAMVTGGSASNTNGTALAIGNGTSASALKNAFSVQFSGVVKAASTITASTTADYAEYFEWYDENPNNEDRVGYFVTFEDGDKIRIATPEDEYILGIVSGEPFVLGNGDCDVWNGMVMRDAFRRTIYEPAPKYDYLPHGEAILAKDKDGKQIYEGTKPKYNPNYDPTQKYINRADRPEWGAVGMLGVLAVRDNGQCQINGYCTIGQGGIAIPANSNSTHKYRVIKRNANDVVEVVFR